MIVPAAIPTDPREELRLWASFRPSIDERRVAYEPIRPLGRFSDFVCTEIGMLYDAHLVGDVSKQEIFAAVEHSAAAIDPRHVDQLESDPATANARVARLDLAWAERLLAVVHGGGDEYLANRDASIFFGYASRLADSQQQYPLLQWSDIAIHHPAHDPRTFLSAGPGRDQEVLLYRVQGGIDRAWRQIVEQWPDVWPTKRECHTMLAGLDAVVHAMANLTRVRDLGEFDKLDVFLRPNDEVTGHATGSFDAWAPLLGYLVTADANYLARIIDATNTLAYDTDARPWIRALLDSTLTPLPILVADCPDEDVRMLCSLIGKRYRDFHKVHRGAVAKHAPGAMPQPAPAHPAISNSESFNRSVGRPRFANMRSKSCLASNRE